MKEQDRNAVEDSNLDGVEITPLTDDELDDVAGGAADQCITGATAICSTEGTTGATAICFEEE